MLSGTFAKLLPNNCVVFFLSILGIPRALDPGAWPPPPYIPTWSPLKLATGVTYEFGPLFSHGGFGPLVLTCKVTPKVVLIAHLMIMTRAKLLGVARCLLSQRASPSVSSTFLKIPPPQNVSMKE